MNYHDNITYDLDTVMEFGKYQGETVEDINDNDSGYIEWLRDTFDVTDEVRAL